MAQGAYSYIAGISINTGLVAYVSKTGVSGAVGDLSRPFPTINSAYTALGLTNPTASNRGLLKILDGEIYDENLVMNVAYIDADFGNAIITSDALYTIDCQNAGNYISIKSGGQILNTGAGNKCLNLVGIKYINLNVVIASDGGGLAINGTTLIGTINQLISIKAGGTNYEGISIFTTGLVNRVYLKIYKFTSDNGNALYRGSGSGTDTVIHLDIEEAEAINTSSWTMTTNTHTGYLQGVLNFKKISGQRVNLGLSKFKGIVNIDYVEIDMDSSTTSFVIQASEDLEVNINKFIINNHDSVAPYAKHLNLVCDSGKKLKARLNNVRGTGVSVISSSGILDMEVNIDSPTEGLLVSGTGTGIIKCKGIINSTLEAIINGITTDLQEVILDVEAKSSNEESVVLIDSGTAVKFVLKGKYVSQVSGKDTIVLGNSLGSIEVEARVEATVGNTDAIMISAANTLILRNAVLIAAGTGKSVNDDGSPRTIKTYQAVANLGLGANITEQVGNIVVDANVV